MPPNGRIFERRSRGILIPGLIAFAVSYSLSLSVAITGDEKVLFAPFLGPILWQVDEGTDDTAPGMAILALAQTAGAVLFALGLRKKKYLEYFAVGERRLQVAAGPMPGGGAVSLRIW